MIGLDRRFPLLGAMPRMLEISLNLEYNTVAKNNLVAKAKSVVSPWFKANDFAPVYALA